MNQYKGIIMSNKKECYVVYLKKIDSYYSDNTTLTIQRIFEDFKSARNWIDSINQGKWNSIMIEFTDRFEDDEKDKPNSEDIVTKYIVVKRELVPETSLSVNPYPILDCNCNILSKFDINFGHVLSVAINAYINDYKDKIYPEIRIDIKNIETNLVEQYLFTREANIPLLKTLKPNDVIKFFKSINSSPKFNCFYGQQFVGECELFSVSQENINDVNI